MAEIDDFILIFGGITESGYTDELWKFNYGSNSYELLTSKDSYPDKLAFSRCQASFNSNNQIIFEVYTGKKSGETLVSSIHEYNYSDKKWITHRESKFGPNDRSKTVAFYMNSRLIIFRGAAWSFVAYKDINIIDKDNKQVTNRRVLPDYTYSAAAVYYKDKIYIHGGGIALEFCL